MSKKPGRNDPCPCGSGKKYKKCCCDKDAQSGRKHAAPPRKGRTPPEPLAAQPRTPPVFAWNAVEDDLDQLSNSVVDLIQQGKLDEAEKACDELDRRFPEMIDCLERRAMLLEARSETKLAADYYRRAAEHARNNEGFDPEMIDYYVDRASRLDPPPGTQDS